MGSNVAIPADLTVGRLLFRELLRNTDDLGTGALGLGDIELPYVSHGSFSSSQNDYDLGTGAVHVLNPGVGGLTISGFVAPADLRRGATRLLINGGTFGVGFLHNQASTSTNRLITPYARTLAMPRGGLGVECSMAGIYYTGSRWNVFPLTFHPDVVFGTDDAALWVPYVDEGLAVINARNVTLNNLLHANSRIRSVVGKVTVAPGGVTTFEVGDAASNSRFATGVSAAISTEFVGLRHERGSVAVDADGALQITAAGVRLGMDANPSDALGRIRVVVFGETFVAPTS